MRHCRRYVRDPHRYNAALRNAHHQCFRSIDPRQLLRRFDCVRNGCSPPVERILGPKFWTASPSVALIRRIIEKLNPRLFDRQHARPVAGYCIQNALQSTTHPPPNADKLR